MVNFFKKIYVLFLILSTTQFANASIELLDAVKIGDLTATKALIEGGADVDFQIGAPNYEERRYTPLTLASENGHFKIVEYLILKGAQINKKSYVYAGGFGSLDSKSALEFAILGGYLNIVEALVEAGATSKPEYLPRAMFKNFLDIAEFLLKSGLGDPNTDEPYEEPLLSIMVKNSYGGGLEAVKLLVKYGANINAFSKKCGFRCNNLILAIKEGEIEIAKFLVNTGIALDTYSYDVSAGGHVKFNYNALMMAAELGYVDLVTLLLDSGSEIEVEGCKHKKSRKSDTCDVEPPLFVAIKNGKGKIAKLLIDRGASLEKRSFDDISYDLSPEFRDHYELNFKNYALYLSAKFYQKSIFEEILSIEKSNPKFNIDEFPYFTTNRVRGLVVKPETALMAASSEGNTGAIELLLNSGADINEVSGVLNYDNDIWTNDRGYTALMIAILNKHSEAALKLLAMGADINVVDSKGNTALIYSRSLGLSDVTEELLKLGAEDPSSLDSVILAAAEEGLLNVIEEALLKGANVNAVDENGNTPLILSAIFGHAEIANALIQAKANLDMVNQNGETALILAVKNDDLNLVEILIKAEADLNVVDESGKNALSIAVKNENLKIIEALIKAGASTD